MKKTVIFGGTFDPITNEHINIIKYLSSQQDIEKIIVEPTFIPPHKEQSFTPFFDRVNMIKLGINGIDKVEISLFEQQQQRVVYSFEVVEHFSTIYPNLFFAMGTDMLESFNTWKNPTKILEKAGIILLSRKGENTQKAKEKFKKIFKKDVLDLNYIGNDNSSSEIRISLKLDVPCEQTTPEIFEYIRQKNLYQKDRFFDYVSQVLPLKRRKHTVGVILCAMSFAKRLGVDEKKAVLGALLHDNAKYIPPEKYPECDTTGLPKSVIHQKLGEYIARNILCIFDEEVLQSILFHTTGKANMTLLQKIVFTADVVEKNRKFDGVEKLRKEVEEDFEKGFVSCVIDLYNSLKGEKLYYLTEQAYLFYKGDKNE